MFNPHHPDNLFSNHLSKENYPSIKFSIIHYHAISIQKKNSRLHVDGKKILHGNKFCQCPSFLPPKVKTSIRHTSALHLPHSCCSWAVLQIWFKKELLQMASLLKLVYVVNMLRCKPCLSNCIPFSSERDFLYPKLFQLEEHRRTWLFSAILKISLTEVAWPYLHLASLQMCVYRLTFKKKIKSSANREEA